MVFFGVVGEDFTIIPASFFSTGDCFTFFSITFGFVSIFPRGLALFCFSSFFLVSLGFAGGVIFSVFCSSSRFSSVFSDFSFPTSFFATSFFPSFASFSFLLSFSTSIFLFSITFLAFVSALTACGFVGMIGVLASVSSVVFSFISGDSFFSFLASVLIFFEVSFSLIKLNFCFAGLSRRVAKDADGERLFAEQTGCFRNSKCFNRSKPSKILC